MKKPSFFYLDYKSKGTDGAPFSPLEPRRRSAKAKEMALISQSLTGKSSLFWGGLHDKKHGKVCPQLPPIFPASTVLNAARHRRRYCGSNPLIQSLGNRTNKLSSDSPATVSSTITEILFLLRRKCPTANIYLFPILPQFDHLKTHFATTNSFIYFQVQEFFSEFFFSTSCHPPYIIKICTGLINSTSPQKAMKFLSGGLTTA